jgi:hypothetical protein
MSRKEFDDLIDLLFSLDVCVKKDRDLFRDTLAKLRPALRKIDYSDEDRGLFVDFDDEAKVARFEKVLCPPRRAMAIDFQVDGPATIPAAGSEPAVSAPRVRGRRCISSD